MASDQAEDRVSISGYRLRVLMAVKELTLRALGKRLGISAPTLHRYANNVSRPTVKLVRRLENVMKVHPGYFDDDGKDPEGMVETMTR